MKSAIDIGRVVVHDQPAWDMAAIAARLDGVAVQTGALRATPPASAHPHQIAQYTGAMFASVPLRLPCTLEIEAELRAMLAAMMELHADTTCVLTGSGTESVLLALLSARQDARVNAGEIVVASNVHPSVLRAAEILGLTSIVTPVDATGRADARAYAQAIGNATVALVVSAPAWASGEIDPLTEIAELASDRRLACHVDASIGGLLFPVWTFDTPRAPSVQVAGVTSVSVDLHKFGYAPRSLSAVCFRDASAAERATVSEQLWDGCAYHAERLGSEPPFAPIAGAWAVMRALGTSGYRQIAQRLCDRRELLCSQLAGSDIEADHARYSHVLRLRPRQGSAQELSNRLQRFGVQHIPCRPGFLRLRIDPLIDDAQILQLSNRLKAAAEQS